MKAITNADCTNPTRETTSAWAARIEAERIRALRSAILYEPSAVWAWNQYYDRDKQCRDSGWKPGGTAGQLSEKQSFHEQVRLCSWFIVRMLYIWTSGLESHMSREYKVQNRRGQYSCINMWRLGREAVKQPLPLGFSRIGAFLQAERSIRSSLDIGRDE